MSLLVNLNEKGFLQIKKDRDEIKKRIETLTNEVNQYQTMLDEFNEAYERLKDFYEPNIIIKRVKYFKGDYYGLPTFEWTKKLAPIVLHLPYGKKTKNYLQQRV
jgi:hypothetical protein